MYELSKPLTSLAERHAVLRQAIASCAAALVGFWVFEGGSDALLTFDPPMSR
jgi:hypothetical protein